MKRKLLTGLLLFAMMLTLLPVTAFAASPYSGTCGDNVTWKFNPGASLLTISGTGPMDDFEEWAPWSEDYEQYILLKTVVIEPGVTSIGDNAFGGAFCLTNVTIPNSVTRIGEAAFAGCEKLTNVSIPNSVKSIGENAFAGCVSLTSIKIPQGVSQIEDYSFYCSGLTSVVIPSSVNSIGVMAFNSTELTSVVIPDGVITIGDYAFDECYDLTSVTIPTSVTSIGNGAFMWIKDIYYGGNAEQWTKIAINSDDYGDEWLDGITIHYNSGSTQSPATGFTDVKPNAWYTEAVQYAVDNGLMNGVGSSQFNPGGTTSRGQLMTILARMSGADTEGSSPWYQKGMDWAKAQGISDGTNPGGNITRQDLATMLWRCAGEPETGGTLSAFPDNSQVSGYAVKALSWAVEQGIVTGKGGDLVPKGTATRAEAATMLMRYCENVKK